MIPEKNTTIKQENPKEKVGVFSLFDIQHFLIRIIKNWYWFLFFGALGYAISFIYNRYYVQRIYASNLSLSISNNTASYFTIGFCFLVHQVMLYLSFTTDTMSKEYTPLIYH